LDVKGVDLQQQNVDGQTPLEFARAKLNSDRCDCSTSVALLEQNLK